MEVIELKNTITCPTPLKKKKTCWMSSVVEWR